MSGREALFFVFMPVLVAMFGVFTAITAIRRGYDGPAAFMIVISAALLGLALLSLYKADEIETGNQTSNESSGSVPSAAQESHSHIGELPVGREEDIA